MRSIFLFAIFIITFSLTISCKAKKVVVDANDNALPPGTWTLKYDRGPCFGYCPVYTFYLLSDHQGLLNVKANLLAPGWYAAPLDQQEVEQLLTLLESDKCWHPDLTDQPTISDQPSHHLEYKHPSGLRTLDVQSRYNTDLSDLFRKLNHLVVESRWDTTSLRPIDLSSASGLDLIVQLKPGIDPATWVKKYSTFGATVKKKISPSQNYYIVAKDPMKGSADEFYQTLKKDSDLIGVQFDSQTEKRNKE